MLAEALRVVFPLWDDPKGQHPFSGETFSICS